MNTPGTRSQRRIIFLCAAAVFWVLQGGSQALLGQISPGPLSKAHEDLSGATQCTSCHKFSTAGGGLKCLECHIEIDARLKANKGFHAVVVKRDNPNKDCARCHSEHNGAKFQLVHWEPSKEKFDHNQTGYPLQGKHASIQCEACHKSEFVRPEWQKLIKQKDLNRTYLGLSPTCVPCHEDIHHGQLGKECQSCHTVVTWKDISRFDHNKTRYPLTGLHAQVACTKCHLPLGPEKSTKYVGLKFASCADCHADPHKGAFQKPCSDCHVTTGWKVLSSSAGVNANFDHDKTNFPLLGKHRKVDCGACHHSGDFKEPIPYKLCSDCHKPDPHKGQFAKRKDGPNCEPCHTVDGWKPSTFTVKDHDTSSYPLEGAHAKVTCAKCHIPKGVATLFKVKFAACSDCHQDQHAGQFVAPPLSNRCESCHTVKTFAPSTYTIVKHQKTKFALEGAHLATPCADCHSAKKGFPKSSAPFHFAALSCTTCHEDVHRGEFKQQMVKKGRNGRAMGCEACHSVKEWKDLSEFDHDQTDYPLVGAHKGVACIDCHKPPSLETTMQHVNFKAAPKECASCHEDVHAQQFARKGSNPTCEQCHNSAKWKPSLFDHEKTAFSLKGAHEHVRCTACHKNLREVAGKKVLFYLPTPKECVACHGAKVPGLPKAKVQCPFDQCEVAPFSSPHTEISVDGRVYAHVRSLQ